jgi:hypothetical protein
MTGLAGGSILGFATLIMFHIFDPWLPDYLVAEGCWRL